MTGAKVKVDAKGQMELDDIDTPLGEAAEALVEAERAVRKSQSARDDAAENLKNEMYKAKLRTLRFKGDTIRYQPGHQTPDKIKFIPSQD